MLRIDVEKQLRDFQLVLAVDVPVGVTLVVGPSGAGKSTLLRLVAGLERPDRGSISLDDRILASDDVFVPPFEREMAVVFQEYALFPHLSVAENVGFGLRARKVPAAQRTQRIEQILARFEIASLGRARVTELSGGERQRVALARALVIEPRALLLDEPLAALDPRLRASVRDELVTLLAAVGVPTLMVTHDLDDALTFPNRTISLENGRRVSERALPSLPRL